MKDKRICTRQGITFLNDGRFYQAWCKINDSHYPACQSCPNYEPCISYTVPKSTFGELPNYTVSISFSEKKD